MPRPSIGERLGVRFPADVRFEMNAAARAESIGLAALIRGAVVREIERIRKSNGERFSAELRKEWDSGSQESGNDSGG